MFRIIRRTLFLTNCVSGLLIALVLSTSQPTQASVITWGSPMTISGDSDVQTNGTLFAAYAFGGPAVSDTTVNGILFSGFDAPATPSVTVGNVTLSTVGVTVNGHDAIFGSGAA